MIIFNAPLRLVKGCGRTTSDFFGTMGFGPWVMLWLSEDFTKIESYLESTAPGVRDLCRNYRSNGCVLPCTGAKKLRAGNGRQGFPRPQDRGCAAEGFCRAHSGQYRKAGQLWYAVDAIGARASLACGRTRDRRCARMDHSAVVTLHKRM